MQFYIQIQQFGIYSKWTFSSQLRWKQADFTGQGPGIKYVARSCNLKMCQISPDSSPDQHTPVRKLREAGERSTPKTSEAPGLVLAEGESVTSTHQPRGVGERAQSVLSKSWGKRTRDWVLLQFYPATPPAPNQMVTTWTPEPISRLFIGGQNYPAPKKLGFTSLRLRENYSLCKEPRKYNAAWEDKPIEWTWLRANTVSAAPVTKAVFTGLHMFTWKRQDKP